MPLEPTLQCRPETDGYLTDEAALSTILALKGIEPGDKLMYLRLRDGYIWRGEAAEPDAGEVSGWMSVSFLYARHGKLVDPLLLEGGDNETMWRLIGWRRPHGVG